MSELEKRYAPGGDIYAANAAKHGAAGADSIWNGYQLDGRAGAARAAAALIHSGGGSTSTVVNFIDQITTDPLAAPAAALDRQIGNAVGNVFKNPWVLAAALAVLAGIALYFAKSFGLIKGKASPITQ